MMVAKGDASRRQPGFLQRVEELVRIADTRIGEQRLRFSGPLNMHVHEIGAHGSAWRRARQRARSRSPAIAVADPQQRIGMAHLVDNRRTQRTGGNDGAIAAPRRASSAISA
jgi:hypothetical protein